GITCDAALSETFADDFTFAATESGRRRRAITRAHDRDRSRRRLDSISDRTNACFRSNLIEAGCKHAGRSWQSNHRWVGKIGGLKTASRKSPAGGQRRGQRRQSTDHYRSHTLAKMERGYPVP